jgi:hypothetical protein
MQPPTTQESEVETCPHTGRTILRRYGNGGIGLVEGVGRARLSKRGTLSPRDKIISDLKSLGMKNTEVSRILHGQEHNAGKAQYIGAVARDPIVMRSIDEKQTEFVREAKERLLDAVPRAVENVVTAIEGGDVAVSMKILGSVGAIQGSLQRSESEVKISFGDWLITQRREVGIDFDENSASTTTRRVLTLDPDELGLEVEGERLTSVSD